MSQKTVLCVADTGCGKTSSMRNLPLDRTIYINVDAKPIPFRHKKLLKNIALQSTQQLINGMDQIEEDENIEYCVIDTVTMLGDMFYAERIKDATNSMAGWSAYKDYLLEVFNKAKRSRIHYIFLAHAQDVYDDKELVTKTFAKIQGSLKGGGIETHFTFVLYNIVKPNEDGVPEYLYLTNKAKGYTGVSAKTPFEMCPTWLPNDIMEFFKYVDKYYEEEE